MPVMGRVGQWPWGTTGRGVGLSAGGWRWRRHWFRLRDGCGALRREGNWGRRRRRRGHAGQDTWQVTHDRVQGRVRRRLADGAEVGSRCPRPATTGRAQDGRDRQRGGKMQRRRRAGMQGVNSC